MAHLTEYRPRHFTGGFCLGLALGILLPSWSAWALIGLGLGVILLAAAAWAALTAPWKDGRDV